MASEGQRVLDAEKKRVCEKISVSLIFYDKFLGWRMPQSFSGNHPALAAL